MHNFVYLAQRRSQKFSCDPNFGGGASPFAPSLAAPVILRNNSVHWRSFPPLPILRARHNPRYVLRRLAACWHLAYVFVSDVGDARRDARRPDEPQVRHEQQSSTDHAAALPISSHQHRHQEPG